jgi:hypothetical protein
MGSNMAHLLCLKRLGVRLAWRCSECRGIWMLDDAPRFWCHGRMPR